MLHIELAALVVTKIKFISNKALPENVILSHRISKTNI